MFFTLAEIATTPQRTIKAKICIFYPVFIKSCVNRSKKRKWRKILKENEKEIFIDAKQKKNRGRIAPADSFSFCSTAKIIKQQLNWRRTTQIYIENFSYVRNKNPVRGLEKKLGEKTKNFRFFSQISFGRSCFGIKNH